MKKLITILILSLAVGCGKSQNHANIPSDWHKLEQTENESLTNETVEQFEARNQPLVRSVENHLAATEEALELSTQNVPAPSRWAMPIFMTDLTVTAQGLIGSLTGKGSPSVIFVWRKQYPKASPVLMEEREADLSANESTTPSDIRTQLEPALKAVLASGEVDDESKLRSSLYEAADRFLAFASSVGENSKSQWWISRIRLDLTIDGSGQVTPTVGLGGDVRFRFEWHRIMPKKKSPMLRSAAFNYESLKTTLNYLAEDLTVLADETPAPEGFKAQGFRVGIGASLKGDVGVVKGAAGLLGHVYFSRDVKKPVVNPKPIEKRGEILLLGSGERLIEREKLRNGLRKAAKIGAFMSRRAPKGTAGQWKVYEMKTGFDMSMSGKLALVELTGLASTEISFYNMNF